MNVLARPSSTLFTLFVLTISCLGQLETPLSWKFTEDVGTGLTQCATLPITLTAPSTAPAYYLIALPIGGTPTTSLIGTSKENLAWVVDQPLGATVMLYVLDSNGGTGTIPPYLFNVTSGKSAQCLPSPSPSPTSPEFTITADPKDELSTCDPWELIIKGGTPPYNVLLAALGSPYVTNASLPLGDNQYTYINRAAPNGVLLSAASDSTGRWAKGAQSIRTKGSTQTDCGGLLSSSGIASANKGSKSNTTAGSTPTPDMSDKKVNKKTPVIIGVCVAVGVLLLSCGIFGFLYRSRRVQSAKNKDLQQFDEMGSQQWSVSDSGGAFPLVPNRRSKPRLNISASVLLSDTHIDDRESGRDPPSTSGAGSFSGIPMNYLPPSLEHPLSKSFEGRTITNRWPQRSPIATSVNTLSDDSRWPTNRRTRDLALHHPPEVIFQHRDAAVVRELPPPYGEHISGPPVL